MQEPKITPLARRLAEENGIDWRRLQGTGPDGTIVERDVLAFLAKLMAGEVDLPPAPEPPKEAQVAPDPEALRRAQEVLGREGVDLEAVLPPEEGLPVQGPTVELKEEELALEDLLLDLEEDQTTQEPPLEAPALEEEWETLLQTQETPAPGAEPPLLAEEWGEIPAEEAPLAEEAWEETLWEEAGEAPLAQEEAWPLVEEERLTEAQTPAAQAAPVPPEPPLAPPPGVAPAPLAGLTPPRPLRVLRRKVNLEALESAQEAYARLGLPETPLPFLYRAAEKALAELEIPLRPLLGQAEGERIRGLRPKGGFTALFRPEGEEAEEGLFCFAGEEEVHTGRPSLFLLPEGLLTLSGLEERLGRAFLDRVALYLENPVLLIG